MSGAPPPSRTRGLAAEPIGKLVERAAALGVELAFIGGTGACSIPDTFTSPC
ncbi:MAG: hypothetical protein ACXVSL_11430 [Solirubrobacteraceae bacterium]